MAAHVSLVWFRHDLRVADNPALEAAVTRGGCVIPVYIWSPEEEGEWAPGAASRWWLYQSLAALSVNLQQRCSRLVLRHGPSLATLHALIRETGTQSVFWNRHYVRRWVPELERLPARWIHKPGEAPTNVLSEAGVKLGTTYPEPVVSHHTARVRALAALEKMKKREPYEC
jgi:deoxyribodipyrimidine photolyase